MATLDLSDLRLIPDKDFEKYIPRSRASRARDRRSGKLPYVRVGGKIYYKPSDIQALIERGRVAVHERNT